MFVPRFFSTPADTVVVIGSFCVYVRLLPLFLCTFLLLEKVGTYLLTYLVNLCLDFQQFGAFIKSSISSMASGRR